jgi:hypothetical protein
LTHVLQSSRILPPKFFEIANSRGDSESHTGQLAVELWDDLAYSLGSTSGGWDDVGSGGASTSPVLVGRSIDGLLGGTAGKNKVRNATCNPFKYDNLT